MSKSKDSSRRSECPISFGLDLFGDKWTFLILRDMLLFKRSRFSDFATPEGISTNILSDRLNRLEQAGIITKKQDPALKNQNIYLLTEKGKRLTPVIVELMLWGAQHDEQTPISKDFIDRIDNEHDQIASDMKQTIRVGEFESYRAAEMGVNANLYQKSKL
ncbi:MAG TPA: helix-turn-helix domain-containing protein [Candidatus Saccharimonadales bacterium]